MKPAGYPEDTGHPGDHYPYAFAEVTPRTWTQVCDRCGHRTRIDATASTPRRRRRPAPPAPLPFREYSTIGFQT